MRLILASASPRRAELLQSAGYSFDVVAPDVDETRRVNEPAAEYVRRLAVEKGSAAAASIARNGRNLADAVFLAADTVVVVDGDILGKPRDDRDATGMLSRLSGRWHEVVTGVSVRSGAHETGTVAVTRVEFAQLSASDIEWYVTSGEGRDKAGAYAIQGLASRFIPRIEGSYANVVGLPTALVRELLKSFEKRYSDPGISRKSL